MTHEPHAGQFTLQELREAFIKQLPAQLAAIRSRVDAFDLADPSPADLADLHLGIHSLSGASAFFGLKTLCEAFEGGRHHLEAAMSGDGPCRSDWRGGLEEYFARAVRACGGNGANPGTSPMVSDMAAAEPVHSGTRRRIVYLRQGGPLQPSDLAGQIAGFGFQVSTYANPGMWYEAITRLPPDAIIMDMVFPDDGVGGMRTLSRIREESGSKIPVVVVSSESDIGFRLAAVRTGCEAYFVKPVDPDKLCDTLTALTSTAPPEPYRIMIVDDDVFMSWSYELILQNAGMKTLSVNDPLTTLPLLDEFKPDLVLMDLHMPGCNGMELTAVIRQMEDYVGLPIVFLSGETDEGLQVGAKRMGADEFLLKTIMPDLLVSFVAIRAQRMKIIRSYITRDRLTGLYNHGSIRDLLDKCVAQARRSKRDLSFAMIDLDHFKAVNDKYGHPAGDKVLVALAGLLKRRLRASDVIGRYGGEEFAVILPGTSGPEAEALMNQLRIGFESTRLPVEGELICSTFSCGVASIAAQGEPEKLLTAADQALYRAKAAGRNRVVAAEQAK